MAYGCLGLTGEEAERDGHGDKGRHHQRARSGIHTARDSSIGACTDIRETDAVCMHFGASVRMVGGRILTVFVHTPA